MNTTQATAAIVIAERATRPSLTPERIDYPLRKPFEFAAHSAMKPGALPCSAFERLLRTIPAQRQRAARVTSPYLNIPFQFPRLNRIPDYLFHSPDHDRHNA
jgi:hypothetical protein